jgi:CPA2 family monovalent cation:H+ antiporter-2
MAYFGHLNKLPVLESLMVKEAKAIIITMSSEQNRRLISEAVLNYDHEANIIVKIDSAEERKSLRDLPELEFVDASFEVADLLVKHALKN